VIGGSRTATGPGQAWLDAAPVLLLIGLAGVLYCVAAAQDRRSGKAWRTASWLTGCVIVAVAVAPVLPGPADPRTHMAQHVLLGMLAPVALVWAAPVTVALRTGSAATRRAVMRVVRLPLLHFLGHPVVAALLSTGGLYLVMLTPLPTVVERHSSLHAALHLHYLAAGYLFAWSIAGPDPAPRRPGVATRAAVLVGAGAAHAFLAKYLYAQAMASGTEATMDAAQLMYYGGDLAELLLAAAMFAGWYRRRRQLVAVPLRS
jgi:cytochrome c oxidase assembly factor CtaG